VAVYEEVPVALHIMDAIVGMEGNGPASGDLRDTNLLLASTDGVALDRVAERIIGIVKPTDSQITALAASRGLGEGDIDKIEIAGGEKIEDFILETPFVLPPKAPQQFLATFVPSWLLRTLAKIIWIRPKPNDDRCVRCGVCADACPVDAITMRGDEVPLFDYKKCITCMCCNEICPHKAIDLVKSPIARLIH
jgi:ferredoxin